MTRPRAPPSEVSEGVADPGVPQRTPDLHSPTPDPGRVHPYGDTLSEASRDEPDVDAVVFVCSSCGYQWERRRAPSQCPNCASSDCFVRAS